jgi:hypothetical protein
MSSTEGAGQEVNAEKTKYMFTSCYQTTGQKCRQRQLINALKKWQSANIWGRRLRVCISFTRILRAVLSSVNSCYRAAQRTHCYPNRKVWNIQHYHSACCFVWVWYLVSHFKERTEFLGTGHTDRSRIYLDITGMKWWKAGEKCIMRSGVICAHYTFCYCIKTKVDMMNMTCNAHGEKRNEHKSLVDFEETWYLVWVFDSEKMA